ncbi:MAG: serine hydrolase domain-containing protein [Actinomycetota bacterium]
MVTDDSTTASNTVTLSDAVGTALLAHGRRTTLDERLAELLVPGIAVVVVADGTPVLELARGATPGGSPMSTDTVLQVGSVSKPIGAVTAAALAASGALSWDGPVTDALTGYDLPLGDAAPEEVTIARLLSHTGGTNVDGFLGYASSEGAPTLTDVLAGRGDTDAVRVSATPGREPRYSGGGYEIVEQAIVDSCRGEPFDEIVRRVVFSPAGMADSFCSLDPPAELLDRVSGGSVNGERLEHGWQRHPEYAAAGLWSTAGDLGRFLLAFNASLADADDALLPTEWSRRLVDTVAPFDPTGPYAAVATGWFLDDETSPTVYRHNGRNIGYSAEIAGTIDGRFGVAVVTNALPGGTELARDVIRTVADQQRWT